MVDEMKVTANPDFVVDIDGAAILVVEVVCIDHLKILHFQILTSQNLLTG